MHAEPSVNVVGSPASAATGAQVCSGKHFAVATAHPAAASAALRTLQRGGSVADAAVAASAVLTVTMPHATSVGGDAFVLLRDAAPGRVSGLNASGTAPEDLSRLKASTPLPQHGALACVVPGLVAAWEAIHAAGSRLPWKGLFDEAVRLAHDGCPVANSLAASIGERQEILRRDPGCAELFLPGGHALPAGATLAQPALARTLRAVAEGGADVFFRGPVGTLLARGVQAAGGALAESDLGAFRPERVQPLDIDYRGLTVHAVPPNSLGVMMLMQLQALAQLREDELRASPVSAAAWQVRAMRAVFETAVRHLGDPAHMGMTAADLLGAPCRAAVLQRMRQGFAPSQKVSGNGTACVTVADAEGNAACIVQSVFNPFGAHFLEPSTGILLNNRLSGFSSEPGTPNSVGPGRRCAHTLNPVLVTEGPKLRLVYASPGGASQTVTGVQVLTNLFDLGLPLGEAISAPRWAMDRQGTVLFEPAWPKQHIDALRAGGLALEQQASDYFYGSATAIEVRADKLLVAAADGRRQAAAMAC